MHSNVLKKVLIKLKNDSNDVADLMKLNIFQALPRLSELAINLRDFDVFRGDICSLFNLETDNVSDAHGNLTQAEEQFRHALESLGVHLQNQDIDALTTLLRSELPQSLDRFQSLFPIIREYVDAEYCQPVE